MLKNLSIKSKLNILSILPILALIILSSTIILDNNNKLDEYTTLEKLVKLSSKVSLLVHETQKERGLTAGFLGSGGKKFKDNLLEQRKSTNNAIKVLKLFIKNNNIKNINYNITLHINKSLANLSNIINTREKISNLDLKIYSAISYYTKMNENFLNLILQSSKISSSSEVSRQLNA